MLKQQRLTVPNVAVVVLQRLGRTLEREAPAEPPAFVTDKLGAMVEVLDRIDLALAVRFRENKPQSSGLEQLFEGATDTSWIFFRKQLEGIRDTYGHPGLRALPTHLQTKVGLDALRERAERAASLHERLFGAAGTGWVRSSWVEQAQTMATILRVIEDDGLTEELELVLGPELPLLLRGLQQHYDELVAARMTRVKHREDFRELRGLLRWHIERYKSAVELMYTPGELGSAELVERALRPLAMLNQRVRRTSNVAELDELLDGDDFVGLGLGEELVEGEGEGEVVEVVDELDELEPLPEAG